MDIEKTCVYWTTCSKYVDHSKFVGQFMIEGPIRPLDQHKNLHFDDEQDIHMSFKKYAAHGCGHDVVLLIISL